MKKLILDMDPGIDDALALILALRSPEIRVLGITTVAGNAPVDMTSANARRVLEYLNVDIPIAAGAAKPLEHPLVDARDYHGSDGLAQCSLPLPSSSLHPAMAWDFIAQLVLSAPGEISLVTTGPLTNIALTFQQHPELPKLLDVLTLMGGAYELTPYGKGNQTPFAEFNIWQDPEAARIVFASEVNIFAVGLDVSANPANCLTSRHLEQVKSGRNCAACLASELVEYVIRRRGRCEMHDPLALAILLDISMFDFISAPVEVVTGDSRDRGITRVLPLERARGLTPVHIATAVDGSRFLDMFLSRVLGE